MKILLPAGCFTYSAKSVWASCQANTAFVAFALINYMGQFFSAINRVYWIRLQAQPTGFAFARVNPIRNQLHTV